MPAVTPGQLLKALNPLLDNSGGIRDVDSSTRIVSLMKDATKMVSKCTYVNICLQTTSEEILQKFISTGGWGMLSQWLQEAKDSDNTAFIMELLKVYQGLPVSIGHLKQDNTARSIKALTKHNDEDVKTLSSSVVDSWMKKIKTKSSADDIEKAKKKKKKDKEREKDQEKEKGKDKEKDKEKEKDKNRDKDREKDKDRHRHRSSDKKDHSHKSQKSSKKDSSEKKTSSADSAQKDRHASDDSREDNSESAESRLGGDTDAVQSPPSKPSKEEEDEKTKRKPKTARVFTNKFRSVFDEDDPTPLPPIKKKTAEELKSPLALAKRISSEITREEPPEKIPRLTLKIITSDASDPLGSPTSHLEVTHGKIKIIAPRKPPAHEIHESNVFMNELTKTSYNHGTMKRRKKAAAAGLPPAFPPPKDFLPVSALKTPSSTGPPTPTTPATPSPGPVSPLTPPAHKLPCVPSFYRDTLEAADDATPRPSLEERSPPSLEKMDTSEQDVDAMLVDDQSLEHSEPPTIHMETEEPTPDSGYLNTSSTVEGEVEGSVKRGSAEGSPQRTEHNGEENQEPSGVTPNRKSGKKRVRWAEETNLRQIFYFEHDETERENVNRPKTFSELKKQDMRSEGRAMESAKRLISDNMVEVLPWRHPQLLENLVQSVDPGCNSMERGVQQQREAGVLQALFFNKQMLPDSPSEPEVESVEPTDIKIIPLVDESCSGEEYEHTYNVDPSNMPYDPAFDITQNSPTTGIPPNGGNKGGGNSSNIQLPPDINNMLASIQQQSIATGGRSLQSNSAVMANVQSILAAIMHGGPNSNREDLVNKLRVALDPLKNQVSSSTMQPGMPVSPNDPQFQPQAPPQRHGLLGNAPPGFNPMMGPGPRPFGPQGPMMGGGGNMDGDWNMNMGNMQGPGDMNNMQGPGGPMGPRGPGFHPMQGPGATQGPPGPPGPNMPGSGPVMQGPRMRKNYNMMRGPDGRFVCRHFATPYGCRFGNGCAFLHPGVNGPSLH